MNSKPSIEVHPIIILGSSRGEGNTMQAIKMVTGKHKIPLIDLQTLNISYYDYDSKNKDDDFIPLAEQMIEHNPLILATPTYWYSMSAIMKTFLDRWSDLIALRKDLGRKLAGKDLYIITSYAGDIPKGFEDPFIQTCQYLKMNYKSCFYFYSGTNLEVLNRNQLEADKFSQKILN